MFIRPLTRLVANVPQANSDRLLAIRKYARRIYTPGLSDIDKTRYPPPEEPKDSEVASAKLRRNEVYEETKKTKNSDVDPAKVNRYKGFDETEKPRDREVTYGKTHRRDDFEKFQKTRNSEERRFKTNHHGDFEDKKTRNYEVDRARTYRHRDFDETNKYVDDQIFLNVEQAKVVLGSLEVAKTSNRYKILEDETTGLRINKTDDGGIHIRIKVRDREVVKGVQIPHEDLPFIEENIAAALEKYDKLKANGKLKPALTESNSSKPSASIKGQQKPSHSQELTGLENELKAELTELKHRIENVSAVLEKYEKLKADEKLRGK